MARLTATQNPNSVWVEDSACQKNVPKEFREETLENVNNYLPTNAETMEQLFELAFMLLIIGLLYRTTVIF